MTSNIKIVKILELEFDWTFIKTKVLEMKSDLQFDTHMFTISEKDGTLISGWIFERASNRSDEYNY